MNKPYIAQRSELAGPMNPTGIINAKYLMLVSALNRGDHPDNVKQALFDWLGEKGFSQGQVVSLLNQDPDTAVQSLLRNFGSLKKDPKGDYRVPEQVAKTLRRTLAAIGHDVRQRRGHEIGQEIAKMRQQKKRYTPEALADWLTR